MREEKIEHLEDLIDNIETYIKKFGKRRTCEKIVELSGLIDPYDERIDTVFEILRKHCGALFVVKLKQTLKSRLIAKESPITPSLIDILGTRVAYIINEALDHKSPVTSLRIVLKKFLKNDLEDTDIAKLPGILDEHREALIVSEKYVSFLDKMGVFEVPSFIEEYVKCIERVGGKLSVEKAIIAVSPVIGAYDITATLFKRVVDSLSENFKSLYGLALAIGYGLIRYVHLLRSNFFAWSAIVKSLSLSNDDMLLIYQRVRKGDYNVIFDILSKLVERHYRGSISQIIDSVVRGKIDVDSAMKILLSTSYATLGVANIMEIVDYISRILDAYWKKHDKIISYVFEIINKIASEAKPAIIRRFLEMDMNRKKLIDILEKHPSVLILTAVNRLVKAYIPVDVGEKISKSSKIRLNVEVISKKIPNWRTFLDDKTLVYFGVK